MLAVEERGIAAVAVVEEVEEHSIAEYRETVEGNKQQTVINALEEGTHKDWRRQDEELWRHWQQWRR